MARFKITETIHHGNYRNSQAYTSDKSVEDAMRYVVARSPYYSHDLPVPDVMGALESVGRAEFGWADYTLEVLDS